MHRVLIIDDDARIRRVACMALRHQGYEVAEAESGLSGLEAMRSQVPDVVLIDVHLEDVDGPEIVRRARAEPGLAGVRAVLMSGGDIEPCEGVTVHLGKPFAIADLVGAIQRALAAG